MPTLQVVPSAKDAAKPPKQLICPSQNFQTPPKRRRSLKGADGEGATSTPIAMKAACEVLRKEFAEDFFLSPAKTRLPSDEILPKLLVLGGQAEACQEALARAKQKRSAHALVTENKELWIKRLEKGFSLLFEGVGSKFRLLESFGQVLFKSGIPIATFQAFDKGTSLAAFLRELLENLEWKGGGSLTRLCAAVLAARRAAADKAPLALIIHNLEALPPAHLSALSALVAAKEIWLVASVDHIFADAALEMDPCTAKGFTFSYEEVHTRESYHVELKGRYPDGLPSCSHPLATKKQAKASLGLVLRCLTQNQRELVEELAKEQLGRGGAEGIPWDEVAAMAADLLIASNHTKLRRLLSELTDHQILLERNGRFELAVKETALRKLAAGEPVDDVDVDEDDAEDAEDGEFSEGSDDMDDDE
ncbi:orc2 [Symbiodinium natans]|uniref:Origin recognition complex subunit 2 n=1 Tax=Symbiodinium natans TaxID=878477 RepID=A0A812PZ94_9DINO|nr:orc2 [Symbiodinium natans]